jgi:hypothetical protein
MSEIVFHSAVGAPGKYEPLYVSIIADEEDGFPPFDAQAAADLTEARAVEGSPLAQFILGHMLLSGQGVPRNEAAAYRWFCVAAASGRADALNMVGRCHERGWGTAIDTTEAARWYRMAADRSHAWAIFNLATLMLAGDGVTRDPAGALSLFVRAARRGNAKAMNMIGHYREEGWCGPVRLVSAVRWYRRAAVRGCFRGQYNLARFRARSGNVDEAVRWLRASTAMAPLEFCRAVGHMLHENCDPRLQAVGQDALARTAAVSK